VGAGWAASAGARRKPTRCATATPRCSLHQAGASRVPAASASCGARRAARRRRSQVEARPGGAAGSGLAGSPSRSRGRACASRLRRADAQLCCLPSRYWTGWRRSESDLHRPPLRCSAADDEDDIVAPTVRTQVNYYNIGSLDGAHQLDIKRLQDFKA
jgi:hypothetical protein